MLCSLPRISMRFLVNFPKDQPKARTRKQHNFSPDRPDIAEFKTEANSALFITFIAPEDLRKIGIHTSVMAGKSGLWRTRKSPRQRISKGVTTLRRRLEKSGN